MRADFIDAHETYAAVVAGRTVGFYALRRVGDRLRLEHLWVSPEAMNQGVGRAMLTHAVERGKALGFRAVEIESDPNADGFYKKIGARRVGASIGELDGQVRELPVLIYQMDGTP